MRRREEPGSLTSPLPPLLSYPPGVDSDEVQRQQDGHGPLFHRSYRTRIRDTSLGAAELMEALQSDLNRGSPTKFARFQRMRGEPGGLCVRRRVRRADAGPVGWAREGRRRGVVFVSARDPGRPSRGRPDRFQVRR